MKNLSFLKLFYFLRIFVEKVDIYYRILQDTEQETIVTFF